HIVRHDGQYLTREDTFTRDKRLAARFRCERAVDLLAFIRRLWHARLEDAQPSDGRFSRIPGRAR
ncbi:MAG: hypothetical protein QME96_04565, partial [Myxococcota bacterium]|nr:hypothetical protein [Myxococcota bacterium]